MGAATYEAAEIISSPAIADMVTGVLAGHVDYLRENGFDPYCKAKKEVVQIHSPLLYEPDYEDEAILDSLYREREKAGYIKGATITTEPVTGRITSAEVSVVLPASLTKEQAAGFYRGDGWRARLHFPSPKNETTDTPRVILDAWRLPYTEVSIAARALEKDCSDDNRSSFDRFYRGVFSDRNAAGIALEARDVMRIVLGLEQETDPATHELVKAVLGFFDQAVRDEVAWLKIMDLSARAEQTIDDNPTVLEQLRIVVAGIRSARQEQKRHIESPFVLLKTGNTPNIGKKVRGKRPLTAEAANRKAAQIAAGPAIRAARAAKRTAAEHTSG